MTNLPSISSRTFLNPEELLKKFQRQTAWDIPFELAKGWVIDIAKEVCNSIFGWIPEIFAGGVEYPPPANNEEIPEEHLKKLSEIT